MNRIPELQNQEKPLALLRARSQTYRIAERLMLSQLLFALALPIGGGIAGLIWPETKPFIATAALLAIVVDTMWMDRDYKRIMVRGAKLGEQFDCEVLDLPWDDLVSGDKPEPELVSTSASAFPAGRAERLRDWYPVAVGSVPLWVGRVICQRSNVRYDARLRRFYAACIKIAAAVVSLGLVAAGLYRNPNLADWVLTMTPAIPFLNWAAREYTRLQDTADSLDNLAKQARSIWDKARTGRADAEECLNFSKRLQASIYRHRATTTQLPPIIYRLNRFALESEMNKAAEDLVREYQTASH